VEGLGAPRYSEGVTAPDLEPWIGEGFEAQQALESARRRIVMGLLAAPLISFIWMGTARHARSIDAGRLNPGDVWPATSGPFELVYSLLWLGVHHAIGTGGLQIVFGSLVALALALAAWGYAKRRATDARFGKEALDRLESKLQRQEIAQLTSERPDPVGALMRAGAPPYPARRASRSSAVLLTRVISRAFLLAPVVLTVVFAWIALGL